MQTLPSESSPASSQQPQARCASSSLAFPPMLYCPSHVPFSYHTLYSGLGALSPQHKGQEASRDSFLRRLLRVWGNGWERGKWNTQTCSPLALCPPDLRLHLSSQYSRIPPMNSRPEWWGSVLRGRLQTQRGLSSVSSTEVHVLGDDVAHSRGLSSVFQATGFLNGIFTFQAHANSLSHSSHAVWTVSP